MDTLDLFSEAAPVGDAGRLLHFHEVVNAYGYDLDEVDIGDITFQAGQAEAVHRWYRLTPSFSPGLVRHFLRDLSATAHDIVLDPFSGRGTTAIECQRQGIRAVSVEINPLLQQVGALSLNWTPSKLGLFDDFLLCLEHELLSTRRLDVHEVVKKFKTALPNIHDVFRWWKPEVLRDLLVARHVARMRQFSTTQHYLWLAVNASALECANIHRNHPTITFDDDHNRHIDVQLDLQMRLRQMQADLTGLSPAQRSHSGTSKVLLGDACRLPAALSGEATRTTSPTLAITSPPYPNRFSYVHQTRPQLHFMELISERTEATEIDLRTIGGTWGRATSDLMRSFIEPRSELREILDYVPMLRPKSTLMCNYATKYFTDLDDHICSLKAVVGRGFRGAYIVGNSRLSGVEIFTECILARLFQRHGFTVERIVLFRKRGGRKRLYETAVCVTG